MHTNSLYFLVANLISISCHKMYLGKFFDTIRHTTLLKFFFQNKIMDYAVVKFTSDSSYSEVPLLWLSEDHQYCYWPTKTKNPVNLMLKNIPPSEDWDKYAVEIESFCCKYSIYKSSPSCSITYIFLIKVH